MSEKSTEMERYNNSLNKAECFEDAIGVAESLFDYARQLEAELNPLRDFCEGVSVPAVNGGLLKLMEAAKDLCREVNDSLTNSGSTDIGLETERETLLAAIAQLVPGEEKVT